jgi:acetyl-CoA synthetase
MGEHHPNARDLSSLRLLGTVGEPINPWKRGCGITVIGGSRCPIYWIHGGKRGKVEL